MLKRCATLLYLFVVTLAAFGAVQHVRADTPPSEAADPITVRTVFSGLDEKSDGVWLARFTADADDEKVLLGLVWSEDTSGWFPIWGLHIVGAEPLMTTDTGAKKGAGFKEGVLFETVHAVTPQGDAEYEAVLSYEPESGIVSVALTNTTTGSRIASGSTQLHPYPGALHQTVALDRDASAAMVKAVDVSPHSVPLGMTWDVVVKQAGQYSRLVEPRVTSSRELALHLRDAVGQYEGELELIADTGPGREEVAVLRHTLAGANPDQYVAVPVDALPLGEFTARLRYVDPSGATWALGSRDVHVVAANVEVTWSDLQLQDDGLLHGYANIRSRDDTVTDLPYRMRAKAGPANTAGTDVRMELEGVLEKVTRVPTAVPFAIPVKANDTLFSLTMDIQFDIPVGRIMENDTYHVLLESDV